MSRRITLLLIIFLMASACLFAGGSKEKVNYGVYVKDDGQPVLVDKETNMIISDDYNPAHSVLYTVLRVIGNTLDRLATVLVVNLHPFPSIMTKFYDYNADYGVATKDDVTFDPTTDLLSSADFYKQKYPSEENKSYSAVMKEDKDQQLPRFAVITSLFIILISCEILFSAIWSYVSGKETFLFKDIVTKIALCFLLFILCAALPFLLEAVRWGLFRMAFYMFPPTSDSIAKDFSIFEMCSAFIDQLVFLMDRCEPSYIGLTDVNGLTDPSAKLFTIGGMGRLLISFLYFVFKVLIFFEFVKAALHIFMNIIEVYILLTVTMILMPFSVFFPTKGFGDKAVLSLFNNLVECFILLLIIIIVVPACVKSSSLLFNSLPEGKNISYHTMIANVPITSTAPNLTVADLNVPTYISISNEAVIMYAQFAGVEPGTKQGEMEKIRSVVYLLYENVAGGKYDATGHGQAILNDILKNDPDAVFVTGSLFGEPTMNLKVKDAVDVQDDGKVTVGVRGTGTATADYPERKRWYTWAKSLVDANAATITEMATAVSRVENEDTPEKTAQDAEKLENRPGEVFVKVLQNDDLRYKSQNSYYNLLYNNLCGLWNNTLTQKTQDVEKIITTKTSDNVIIKHMVIIFICVYLPCYFVMQSSQLTQALMQGGVAQESFSNALSQSAHNTMTAPIKAAATVAGGVFRTGLDIALHSGGKGGGHGSGGDPPNSIQNGI